MKKNLYIIIFLFIFFTVNAQDYPQPIFTGQKVLVEAKQDTLWIITNSQLNNTLITAKELENANLQIINYQKQINLLNEQLQRTDTLLFEVQKTLQFYQESWQECENNVKVLIDDNKRLNTKFKIVRIVGIVGSFIAFVLGAYLL